MTNLKRIVGLTGGMGAGKSTIVDMMRREGIMVFDCDETVHAIYRDESFLNMLHERFDLPHGEDPRAFMSKQIVQEPEILNQLEEMSKEFFRDILDQAIKCMGPQSFLLLDAPILFETGMDNMCDSVITIQCPIEVRKQRVMERPGMTEEKMELLMSRQLSEGDRLVRSQYIIHNTGTIEEARTKAVQLAQHLKGFYYDNDRALRGVF